MRKLSRHLCLLACIGVTSCGPPEPINMRQQFGQGIRNLGVIAFYPLRESARLGQIYLVDGSTAASGGDSSPGVPTSVVVTNAAVPIMETLRADHMAPKNRYPCSSDKLSGQIVFSGQAPSYYQQPDCSSSAAAASDGAAKGGATPGNVVINIENGVAAPAKPATPAANKPADKKTPDSLAPLELAGIPSYSLASIENMTLAGSAPTVFANFLASIGFSRSTSLQVQAEGVEVATLPADEFAQAIRTACDTPSNPFGNLPLARASIAFANEEMRANADTRAHLSGRPVSYKPVLFMLRTVYYLRGIRYIFNDTRAYSAAISAAADAKIPAAQQQPVAPNISMNVVTAPQTDKTAAASAQMAALQSQISSLRSAISSGSNIQIGASYAGATARGIEFVDLFQRPLAFGYTPLAESFYPDEGLERFCADARGTPMPERQPAQRTQQGG